MSALKTRQDLLKMSKTEFTRFMKKCKLYKPNLGKNQLINKYLEHVKSIKSMQKKAKDRVKKLSLTQRSKYLCSGYIEKDGISNSIEENLYKLIIAFIGNIFITLDVYNKRFAKCMKQTDKGIIFHRECLKYRLTTEEYNSLYGNHRTKNAYGNTVCARILIGSSCGMRGGKNKWRIKMLCDWKKGYLLHDAFGVTNKLKYVRDGYFSDQETLHAAREQIKLEKVNNYPKKGLILFDILSFKKDDIFTLILDCSELELRLKCNGSLMKMLSIEKDRTYYPVILSQCDNRKYQLLNY
eukprot:464129_1